jgi:hypothetical protein
MRRIAPDDDDPELVVAPCDLAEIPRWVIEGRARPRMGYRNAMLARRRAERLAGNSPD